MDTSKEFPDYKSLSLRLYKVLEDLGVSADVRDTNVKVKTTFEILEILTRRLTGSGTSLINNLKRDRSEDTLYICGSCFEGTTTPGLRPDFDQVKVMEICPVVSDITDAQQHEFCLLTVQNPYTAPGYVMLQYVHQGVPLFESDLIFGNFIDSDKEGRRVFILGSCAWHSNAIRRGPANSHKGTTGCRAQDIVYATRCCKWPHFASKWLNRQRPYNWPSRHMIAKCETLCCFFVFVGHPLSEERDIEWRISFTLQERMLVSSFNSVQLKCYVLMKIIKKEIIETQVMEETITSYHYKTCLLNMIENTPAEFWVAENLLNCLNACFNTLLVWIKNGICPNYFIPEENMFHGRISTETQIGLQGVLASLQSTNIEYLLRLETDDLGGRLQQTITGVHVPWYSWYGPYNAKLLVFHDFVTSSLLQMKNVILQYCSPNDTSVQVVCKKVYRVRQKLQLTKTLAEHKPEDIDEASSLMLPYIDISFASLLVVTAKHLGKSKEFIRNLLLSDRWSQMSLSSDLFSHKLKQASLLYMSGDSDISLEILNDLEHNLRGQLSLCGCMSATRSPRLRIDIALDVQQSNARTFLRHYVVPCVVYLPAEIATTPTALTYEMFRSDCVISDDNYYWHSWSVVDGKVLFYFLLYLNHHQLDMEANALADIDNIKWHIKNDGGLGHRETALNLLGWIYKERGLINLAVECFEESINLLAAPNAAFRHMRDIHRE